MIQAAINRAIYAGGILIAATFASTASFAATESVLNKPLSNYVIEKFGPRPSIPTGPLPNNIKSAIQTAFVDSAKQSAWGPDQVVALNDIAESKDPRLVWIIADLLRFAQSDSLNNVLTAAASKLFEKPLGVQNSWGVVTDHLIAWNIP